MNSKKVPGGYVLNGRKCFISNGSVATYTALCCATDRERPLETWTSFLIHKDMEGFSGPRVEEKMGQRACPAAELSFEDCSSAAGQARWPIFSSTRGTEK